MGSVHVCASGSGGGACVSRWCVLYGLCVHQDVYTRTCAQQAVSGLWNTYGRW